MKLFIKTLHLITLLYLISDNAQAYHCPSYLQNYKEAQTLHTWVKKMKNINELHGCQVQVTTCNNKSREFDDNSPIGEVLVINSKGQEGYVQIRLPDKPNKIQSNEGLFVSGHGYFNYTYWDLIDEDFYGKMQQWKLSVYVNSKTKSIDRVSLGIYSHNRQLNQDNNNDSRWYTCEPK